MATQDPKVFIRSMPNASPDDVVKAAKKAGLSVEAAYVQRLRIIDKARGASASARKGKAKGGSKAAATKDTKTVASAKVAPPRKASGKGARPVSTGTPSDFIRAMPHATTAEIMGAAKKSGLKFSRGLVYMVRSKAGAKKEGKPGRPPKPAKVSTPAAAKKKPGRPPGKASGSLNKSAFIRSMPTATPGEVVIAAKAKGLVFTDKYVSTIRSNERAAGKKSRAKTKPAPVAAKPLAAKAAVTTKKRGPGRPPKASSAGGTPKRGPGRPRKTATTPAAGGDVEKALKAAATAVVLAHGLVRAQAVLDGVIARIRAAGNG